MIDLRFFKKSEFRDWWDRMSVRQLILMDVLRYRWGASIRISPVTGALGREKGPDNESQHNVDRWDEVRAADMFLDGMTSRRAAERAVRIMREAGFTGIGVYPDWSPCPGVHGDTRTTAEPGNPAVWGMIDDGGGQYQVSLSTAFARMEGVG